MPSRTIKSAMRDAEAIEAQERNLERLLNKGQIMLAVGTVGVLDTPQVMPAACDAALALVGQLAARKYEAPENSTGAKFATEACANLDRVLNGQCIGVSMFTDSRLNSLTFMRGDLYNLYPKAA